MKKSRPSIDNSKYSEKRQAAKSNRNFGLKHLGITPIISDELKKQLCDANAKHHDLLWGVKGPVRRSFKYFG